MYNTRKNPIFKSQPSLILKAKHENFKPQADWKEDQYNHMLLIQLPGFKREDIRVQLDNAGKLFVKGSRLTADNRYLDVEQSFEVPKDAINDKISGKFEDGLLSLFMPKSVTAKTETATKDETTTSDATKEEKSKHEATKAEQPKLEEEKHEQGKSGEEKKDDTTSDDNEANQLEKPTITEAAASLLKDAKSRILKATLRGSTQRKEKEFADADTTGSELNPKAKAEEMPKSNYYNEMNKHEEGENRKAKTDEGIMHREGEKVEQAIMEMKGENKGEVKASSSEVKRDVGKIKGTMQKMKLKFNEIYRDTPKINKMRQGEDGWLNSKYADGALEKINQNRHIIAVAVLAFSVGLYTSHKLKSRSG